MAWLRDIDRWFVDEVLPHADAYHRQACRWAVDGDAARDIVQDAYARVIGLPNWRGIGNPKAYVMLIVRNVAIDRLRQARLVPFVRNGEMALALVEDRAPDAVAHLEGRQRLERVRAAVAALPPQCRRCVELRKFDDRSPGQIAEIMGLSVSTVEKHLVKGLRIVMQALAAETDSTLTVGQDQSDGERRPSSNPGRGLAHRAGRGNG